MLDDHSFAHLLNAKWQGKVLYNIYFLYFQVVFVGGSGYVPPNSLRTRPSLDADPLWQARPLAESRYPVPLQSAWDRNYRNPFNMTRVQRKLIYIF